MHIHCFQHASFETPGAILNWVIEKDHTIGFTCFFNNEFTLPALHDIDALIIMGGNMNVDEEDKYNWLKTEKDYILKAIKAGKKVLGICLGAQLIAAALGKKVFAAPETEIGFFPVRFNQMALNNHLFNHFAPETTVFHWHGDTFDLPDGALPVASSKACKNQAYLIGDTVLGLQFHLEMTAAILDQMMIHDGDELSTPGRSIQDKNMIHNQVHTLNLNSMDLMILLDKFFTIA
jgi:GMP synthase-like glutamine amidotransferase